MLCKRTVISQHSSWEISSFTGTLRQLAEKSVCLVRCQYSLALWRLQMNHNNQKRIGPSFIPGLVIIIIGLVTLLNRLGYLAGETISQLWPLVLVFIGISAIVIAKDRGPRMSGSIMIIIGGALLLHQLGYIQLDWQFVWPTVLILVGLYLLWWSLFVRARSGGDTVASDSVLNKKAVFGGGRTENNTQDFKGGDLMAVFGGYEIDLSRAGMKQNEAVLFVNVLFGGFEIRVPEDWNIVDECICILGGVEDKTRHPVSDMTGKTKKLIVRGHAALGGIQFKN